MRERKREEEEETGRGQSVKHTLRSVWEFLAFALKATRNAYAIKCALESDGTKKGEKKCE